MCEPCFQARQVGNLTDLVTHSGPWFEHWRYRIAASVGAVLPEPRREPDDG